MKKIRFFDSTTNAMIANVRDPNIPLQKGQIISPLDSPNGRVIWEVVYVEVLDYETRDVYIIQRGFIPK